MSTATKLFTMAILTAVSLTGPFTSARAAEATSMPAEGTTPVATSPEEDKWVFNSPLYLWAAGLTGTATVQGNTTRVDLPFNEIYDHLDVGFMGYFELAKPKYGFYVLPVYDALTFDGKAPAGNKLTLNVDMWIVEAAGFYRIWDHAGDRPASLYAVAGIRYWNIHSNLKIQAVGSGATTDWLLDPMIGLRFSEYITKRVHIMGQTDIGGFDLGQQTSRFSWSLTGSIGYDFTMPVVKFPSTVFAGWRQLNVQHSQGNEGINLNMSGPLIGLNVSLF